MIKVEFVDLDLVALSPLMCTSGFSMEREISGALDLVAIATMSAPWTHFAAESHVVRRIPGFLKVLFMALIFSTRESRLEAVLL